MPGQDEKHAARRKAVAVILAKGALRCRWGDSIKRRGPGRQKPPESSQNCLERSKKLRPPVPTGYGQET